MYQRQFGLEQTPFGNAASGDQVYTGTARDKAVANLKIGLSTHDAVVALVGPVGVGKSTLALRAVQAASNQVLTAVVSHLPLSADDLLEMLIAEFGINSEANTTMARFQDLRCFFAEQTQEDYRLFILVEDAVTLGQENLQLLGALTASDPRGYTGANLILMGDPALLDLLNTESLGRLMQRVRTQQSLDAFSAEETKEYIAHRIVSAGGQPQDFVDDNVGLAVFQSTQGVARMIDNLMDTALCFAFSRKQGSLLPTMVQKVARSIYGLPTEVVIEPASATAPEPVEQADTDDSAPSPEQANNQDPEQGSATPTEEAAAAESQDAVAIVAATATSPASETDANIAAVDPVEAEASAEPVTAPEAPEQKAEETAATEEEPANATPQVAAESEGQQAPQPDITPATEVAQAVEAPVSFDAPRPTLAEVAIETATVSETPEVVAEPPQEEISETAPQSAESNAAELPEIGATSAPEPNVAPAVDTPAQQDEIPVLEDAIELALMQEDASVIAEALAVEPVPAETDENMPAATEASAAPDTAAPAETPAAAEVPATIETTGTDAVVPPQGETPPAGADSFEDWAASVAQAASLEELDAQIAETLFGSPDLDSLGDEISAERQAAKPIEERSGDDADSASEGIVPNNVAGGGLG